VLRKTLVEKSPEQKARETADFIIKIKENRFNLMSGYQEVSYDKETFAMMNQEMEKLESEYQKLFTGLTFTKTLTYRFWYTPEAQRVSDSVPLFRISRLRGIQEVSSQYGETVFLTVRKNNNTYLLSDYIRRKPAPKNGVHGFYYRIPEHADLTICVGDKALIKGKFLVSQYGVIHWLPAARTHMQFHPASGSLKQLEIRK
jgi:hypothetical protein